MTSVVCDSRGDSAISTCTGHVVMSVVCDSHDDNYGTEEGTPEVADLLLGCSQERRCVHCVQDWVDSGVDRQQGHRDPHKHLGHE